jgi:hypothetical protein
MDGRLARTPVPGYVGERPNAHDRTLTDKPFIMRGLLSGTSDRVNTLLPLPGPILYSQARLRSFPFQ